jgi:hypothetical protein
VFIFSLQTEDSFEIALLPLLRSVWPQNHDALHRDRKYTL